MKYLGNNVMQITQAELDALMPLGKRADWIEDAYYRSVSVADHTPMVVEVYEHPLEGLRTRFYRVKIEPESREE